MKVVTGSIPGLSTQDLYQYNLLVTVSVHSLVCPSILRTDQQPMETGIIRKHRLATSHRKLLSVSKKNVYYCQATFNPSQPDAFLRTEQHFCPWDTKRFIYEYIQ